MIPIEVNTPQNLEYKISELSSPCKPAMQIDFLGLVKRSTSIMSTLSTNDGYSVRTEDDTSKTILGSDDFDFKTSKQFSLSKSSSPPLKTLQEIVTKRKYTRKTPIEKEDKALEESTIKKRKLNNHSIDQNKKNQISAHVVTQFKEASSSGLRDHFPVPQLVIKNGVTLLEKPELQERTNMQNLEVIEITSKKVTTSSSFKKIRHTEKWTKQETKKFYRALELFGTDFSMIAKLFQNRNRNQIKNKFLKEEKSSCDKINATFNKTKNINFTQLINRFKAKTSINNRIIQDNITENQVIRSQRSGSFNSAASLDSVDMSIMDDLADVLIPFSNKQSSLCSNNTMINIEATTNLKIEFGDNHK